MTPRLSCSPRRRPWRTAAVVPLILLVGALPAGGAIAAVDPSSEPEGVWPLRPRPEVVRPFDPPQQRWDAGHRGVDLAGQVGQQVHTALGGRVGFARRIAGVGVVVVVHGATRTTYQPVTASVREGDQLEAGDVLGRLSWFGTHCLPAACLHWGLLEGDRYLDPLRLVGGPVAVRLLPLADRGTTGLPSARLVGHLVGAGGHGGPPVPWMHRPPGVLDRLGALV